MLPRALGEAVIERKGYDIEPEIRRALNIGVATEDIGPAPWPADIAGGKEENAARAYVGGTNRVLRLPHGPNEAGRSLLCEHLGHALELLAWHARHALNFFGRPLLDFLANIVHAIDALFDELLIFPTTLEDVPEHAPKNGDVGARAQAHVLRRMGRGARQTRIGDNEVRPVELLALEQMLQRDRMRLGRIAAQEKQRFAVANIRIAVCHGAVAPGVGYAGDRGRMTNARLVVRIVRSPEGREFAIEICRLVRELGRSQPIDGIGPRLLADLHQLVADLVDRLIPRDLLPLTAGKLQRIAQAPIALHDFTGGGPLRAMRAPVDRALPAGLLADPHAVFNFGNHRASHRTMRANILALHRAGGC